MREFKWHIRQNFLAGDKLEIFFPCSNIYAKIKTGQCKLWHKQGKYNPKKQKNAWLIQP